MAFLTNNTDRLYIAAAGNIGIGSTIPVVSLDLSQKTDARGLTVRYNKCAPLRRKRYDPL